MLLGKTDKFTLIGTYCRCQLCERAASGIWNWQLAIFCTNFAFFSEQQPKQTEFSTNKNCFVYAEVSKYSQQKSLIDNIFERKF
jgi:hypothetical protein